MIIVKCETLVLGKLWEVTIFRGAGAWLYRAHVGNRWDTRYPLDAVLTCIQEMDRRSPILDLPETVDLLAGG